MPRISKFQEGWCAVDRAGRPLAGCTPRQTSEEAEADCRKALGQDSTATEDKPPSLSQQQTSSTGGEE